MIVSKRVSLSVGKNYSNEQIVAQLGGGNLQSYLVSVQGNIVGARLSRRWNPDAPDVILVGSGQNVLRDGKRLIRQGGPIEIFVKETPTERTWTRRGKYVVDDFVADSSKLKRYERDAGRKVALAILMKPAEFITPVPQELYYEGACEQITIDRRERNPKARKACLEHFGYRCIVCELLFEERYGPEGSEFIHVHHLKPLAGTSASRSVDPIKDLRPICPNCHAMIHKRAPIPFTVEELKTRMSNAQSSSS